MAPAVGDFPFDLFTALAKFLRRLLDNAFEVDFESAWLIWDLIEIAIFIAATLLFLGLVRQMVRQKATNNGIAVTPGAGKAPISALNAALEIVEMLQRGCSGAEASSFPENQKIREAASVLLASVQDAEASYPLVTEVVRGDRLVIGPLLVDQFVSLAAKCRHTPPT